MNWKKISIERLSEYPARQRAVENLSERLKSLELSYASIKAARTDGSPITGGGKGREDALINNIVERQELKRNLRIVQHEVRITRRGLDSLTSEEKEVLFRFYIAQTSRHVEELCQRLNYEKTKIYVIKDRALKNFTRACYGIVEL